jgi:CDP-6-deoxy-D-xylo-4-hexulose-3-dehydrase
MISTNDEEFYHHLLLLRSHGMLRELPQEQIQKRKIVDIDERFTFLCPGYNVRNTDLHAVLGISQMRRMDTAVSSRERNFKIYIDNIDKIKYHCDFTPNGVSLFSFPIICKNKNVDTVRKVLTAEKIENRPLIAGNLFRHPMTNTLNTFRKDTNSNFIHDNSLYVGNSEFVSENDVLRLTKILNNI